MRRAAYGSVKNAVRGDLLTASESIIIFDVQRGVS